MTEIEGIGGFQPIPTVTKMLRLEELKERHGLGGLVHPIGCFRLKLATDKFALLPTSSLTATFRGSLA